MASVAARHLTIELPTGDKLLEQTFRTLAERLPALMEVRRKKLQDRDIEALLDLMAPVPPADDTTRAIEFDNALARKGFLEDVACLSSKEVAALAGHTAKNTSVTASRWKQAGKLFAVPRAGEELYPAFQFRDGKPHPTVARALAALSRRKSPWQVAFWFTSGNGWLDGATPAERLDDADAVTEAARREAEDIIG